MLADDDDDGGCVLAACAAAAAVICCLMSDVLCLAIDPINDFCNCSVGKPRY